MRKILSFAYFFICAMMLFSVTALAYIDPSAMTYMIQLIAGIAIAAGAGFGFYFRKIRRRLAKFSKKDRPADYQSYDDDDDDMTGFGDYEIEDAAGSTATDRSVSTSAAIQSRPVTDSIGVAATAPNPSTAGLAAAGRPAVPAYESLAEACSTADRAVSAPDPYDETGGESGLLAENQRLHRLLLEEQQKVEQLKQALHICTAPRK